MNCSKLKKKERKILKELFQTNKTNPLKTDSFLYPLKWSWVPYFGKYYFSWSIFPHPTHWPFTWHMRISDFFLSSFPRVEMLYPMKNDIFFISPPFQLKQEKDKVENMWSKPNWGTYLTVTYQNDTGGQMGTGHRVTTPHRQ